MKKEHREYRKVVDYIYALVENEQLSIGSRLPTERTLAEELGVGRNSIREALRMLENMGLVESRQGSGNYIACNPSAAISEAIDMMLMLQQTTVEEVCSFRRGMEKAVCQEAIKKGISDEMSEEIEALLSDQMYSSDAEVQAEVDHSFHYALIRASGNQMWICVSEAVINVYRRWIERVILRADESVRMELRENHREIFNAIKREDRDACEKAIDRHYDIADRELSMKGLYHD
ncbi:MAG: GntR family transcriptional regulator [Bacillota bacterium]|nr:GntR family transcriptional regulator [Bacillota bacterium]